jgi:hypothetical protein
VCVHVDAVDIVEMKRRSRCVARVLRTGHRRLGERVAVPKRIDGGGRLRRIVYVDQRTTVDLRIRMDRNDSRLCVGN